MMRVLSGVKSWFAWATATGQDRVFVDPSGALWCEFAGSGLRKEPVRAQIPQGLAIRGVTTEGAVTLTTWALEAKQGEGVVDLILDVFLTEDAAKKARERVLSALQIGAKGQRTWRRKAAIAVGWFLGTAVMAIVILGIIGIFAGPALMSTPAGAKGKAGADVSAALLAQGMNQADLTKPPPEKINPGAIPLDHTIPVGTAGKPRIFVFLDPLCEYCRQMDSQVLPELAKDYDIRIVPVPAKGKESATLIAQAFCSKSPAAGWRATMNSGKFDLATTDRNELTACVTKAMENYVSMRNNGFAGTPTVVAPDGRVYPNGFANAVEIRAFLEKP